MSEAVEQKRKTPKELYFIVGIFVAVLAISTLLGLLARSGSVDIRGALGTSNQGQLLEPPRQLMDLPIQTVEGGSFSYIEEGKRRWSMVIPVDGACDKSCEEMLYLTRQVHTAMGAKSLRIRRLLLSTQKDIDLSFLNWLKEEHPKLQVLSVDRDKLISHLGETTAPYDGSATMWLADLNGWLMMAYNRSHTGKEIMKDLKFLLTNSPEK